MWIYEKKLLYPVKITYPDRRMAKKIRKLLGRRNGELSGAINFLNQRYNMPTPETKALLTDIGTEELAHVEMIQTMIVKLTDDESYEEIEKINIEEYYEMSAPCCISSTGDPIADLYYDLATEQRMRAQYEKLIQLTDDPALIDSLRFLREREVVHFQRFGEALSSL